MGSCNENVSQSQYLYNNINWELITENHYSVIMKSYANPKIQLQKWLSDKVQKPIIYSWRANNQKQGFCKIQHMGEENYYDSSSKEKQKHRSYVITQILTPLSQIQHITTCECILLLKLILPALKLLCEKFGWFQVSTDNLFINSEGKPSIWIHPNIASNSPIKHYSATTMTQETFIASVITVIRRKLEKYQKLQISSNYLGFRKIQIWLEKQLNNKYSKLTKIYKNRGEFELSDERRKYKQIARSVQQISRLPTNLSKHTKTQSKLSIIHKKQQEYSNKIYSGVQQKTNASNARFLSSVKDPDQLLFEMIRDFS